MTARLVPYRSLRQLEADATLMAVMNGVAAAAVRVILDDTNPFLRILSVVFAILATTLLSEVWANARAARRGAELISYDEWTRRILAERADQPVWQSVVSLGSASSLSLTIMLLAGLDIEHWPYVALGTAIAAVVGGLSGAYVWTYARTFTRATGVGATSPNPTPFTQVAMRHYAGYALGLAFAFVTAAMIRDDDVATAAIFIAFFVGKVVSDTITPAVFYTTMPQAARRLGEFVTAIAFGVI